MTTFDLRRFRLWSGEQHREAVEIEIEPLIYGGQRYLPVPQTIEGRAGNYSCHQRARSSPCASRTDSSVPCYRCLKRGRVVPADHRQRIPRTTTPMPTRSCARPISKAVGSTFRLGTRCDRAGAARDDSLPARLCRSLLRVRPRPQPRAAHARACGSRLALVAALESSAGEL